MVSLKKTAHFAGMLYILLDIPLIFSGMVVDLKVYVPGDAAATAVNILSSDGLFRLGIVSNLAGTILFLFLALTLYNLFHSVNPSQARLMVILVAASVPATFIVALLQSAPLLLLNSPGFLPAFNALQLQTLSLFFFDLYLAGVQVSEIFWGLWLIPLGVLAYRSGFVPKALGVLVIIGCLGHLLSFLATFLFPGSEEILTTIAETVMIGELPIVLWLLIKGVKVPQDLSQAV